VCIMTEFMTSSHRNLVTRRTKLWLCSSSLKEHSWKESKVWAKTRLLGPLSIKMNFTDLFGPEYAETWRFT